MQQPIQVDHELVCPGCGAVLQNVHETLPLEQKTISFNIQLLGSAIKRDVRYHSDEDRLIIAKENVLRFLIDLVHRYGVPEIFATETYRFLLKKNRGWFSKGNGVAVKQLLKILEKDDNYLYWKKAEMIKKDYEEIINR